MAAAKLTHDETALQHELTNYGLNPHEWAIIAHPQRDDVYEVAHRHDPDFKMNLTILPNAQVELRLASI